MTAAEKQSPLEQSIRERIAGKAKPPGSLGRLEELAVEVGLATGTVDPHLGSARLVIFAGDHGITAEQVAAYPSSLTREIVRLVLEDKAGANICTAGVDADVVVVDAGILTPPDAHPRLISRRIGPGTKNARREPAMTLRQYQEAFDAGQAVIQDLLKQGVGLFALGEIGIGNSGPAALLAHSATDIPLATLVGPGTGPPKKGLDHKRQVLSETYARAFGGAIDCDPRSAFVQFAGFEMVMMAGAIHAIAAARKVAIIDGFIVTAVAAGLFAIEPECRRACVFAHTSGEPGHKALLQAVGGVPLLDLGLRLGEGTGAVLAIPLVRAAERMLTQLADLPGGGAHPAQPVV